MLILSEYYSNRCNLRNLRIMVILGVLVWSMDLFLNRFSNFRYIILTLPTPNNLYRNFPVRSYLHTFHTFHTLIYPHYTYRPCRHLTPKSYILYPIFFQTCDPACLILSPNTRHLNMEMKKVKNPNQSRVTCCKIRAYEICDKSRIEKRS
jgi:hypothetical protein